MRQIYKRLLTTLVLISATQTSSVVQAEGIRLVGPSGEVQSSPSYAEEIERALPAPPANSQPSRFIGPTGENQTLWSIASQVRPSRSVTVQQTLLAIYRINPQAFENQNIHELIPGSRLRLPSLEQVQSASTEQAVAIMKAHEAKLKQTKPVTKPKVVKRAEPQPTAPQVKQEPVSPQPVSPQPESVTPVNAEPVKANEPIASVPPVNTSAKGEQQVTELKAKLQGSQSELSSLEEKNHRLRLMLSEVQSEVQTLKNELNDEERIRSEVEKLLAEERQRADEQQRMQPTALDKFLSNGWLVGLAALIPGALLAFLVVMLLGRRSKEEEPAPASQQQSPAVDPLAAPIGLAAADELEEELNLDDDLFADEENDILSEQESTPELEDDVFAGLEDEELDFNLEGDDGEDPFAGIGDDGDLDVGFDEFESSTNGIKVNGEEKALGLEEMERALDEASPELEVLDEPDFDLSEGEGEEFEKEDLFAELLADDTPEDEEVSAQIDQATLDELLAELDDTTGDLDEDSSTVSDHSFTAGEASDDEIDNLLAQYEQSEVQTPASGVEPLLDSNEQEGMTKTEELSASELDDSLFDLSDSNDNIDENSTDLLDELIEFDGDESDDEFDPLDELESLSGFGSEEFEELDADSVDLLDELLDDDINHSLEDEVSSDPFDDLIREDDTPESELNQREQSAPKSESTQDFPLEEAQASQIEPVHSAKDNLELESDLDIDALLNEHQPELLQQPENQEPEKQASETAVSDEFLEDIEDISLEYDPLMRELDELFESSHDDASSEEQDNKEEPSELDSLSDELEESLNTEEKESEPEFTPTPNAVENEFGMPLEEDWLLDESEPESETKQELEPTATTSEESDEDEFAFDELELPEFSEEDALASMADEPELAESESELPEAVSEADDEFEFDELELPEFSEEDALASMADEPELADSESERPEAVSEADDEFEIDELELPEFSEEDALASMVDEPKLADSESERPLAVSEADDEFEIDELELPEFSEEDALASMADEPELAESESERPEAVSEADDEFEIDELELPEFSEEDALASMADEPELTESESERPEAVSEADDEFEIDELELPEFTEDDALASMSDRMAPDSETPVSPKITLKADNDHDALFELFAQQQNGLDAEPEPTQTTQEPNIAGLAESDMESLLSEKGESEAFEGQLDRDTIDSAGMDFETMFDIGDDWEGFKTPNDNSASEAEDVPEDQRDIWNSEESLSEPEIAEENWEQQTALDDFDPKKSQFMTIDELMAQVDNESGEFEEQDLKLDVGLNEFPDVIGDITDVDVDSDAEGAGKLDLAKIYLEMNDPKGAIKLLEEAIVFGEDDVRREAKNLIDSINGR
ncbi:AAA family ATPase [Vibrio natriegens]|uniref:FimV/HubP family polar landmark protein n=1 Tax=Vibrio natriegens TaxID=691 RepID=UPI000803D812|nr:FimV/HubP family polar landmark protein [Vibrio natriegens]ANQ26936.1 AAA family ATPase [Vibrio natriegens]